MCLGSAKPWLPLKSLWITKKQECEYQGADGSKGLTHSLFPMKIHASYYPAVPTASCPQLGPQPWQGFPGREWESPTHCDMAFSCLIWMGMKKFLPVSQKLKSQANRISKHRGTSNRAFAGITGSLLSKPIRSPTLGRAHRPA